jgi:hypothetical protein
MAQVVIGAKITADTNGATESVKSFRTQLREAQADVVKISEKFGETSKQAAAAAQKAALLKDKIGDAKDLVAAFNPDKKFQAFSGAINGVTGGFTALQGAMGLVGAESQEVQKQLLKVQSAMALAMGLNQITASIDAFKNLGTIIVTRVVAAFATLKGAILTTGIGALVVGIGAVIAYFKNLGDAAEEAAAKEKEALELRDKYAEIGNKAELAKIDRDEKLAVARAKNAGKSEKEILSIQQQAQAARVRSLARFTEEVGTTSEKGLAAQKQIDDIKSQIEIDRLNFDTAAHEKRLSELKKFNDKEESEAARHQKELAQARAGLKGTNLGGDAISEEDAARNSVLAKEKASLDISIKNVDESVNAKIALQIKQTEEEKRLAQERIQQAQAEADMKIALADQIGSATGALADLVGRQTVAGKVLALAQIAEGVGVGFIHALRIAQQSATATGPAAAFAFPVFYASQVAAVLAAAARAKSVLNSGSGGGGGSVNTGSGAGGSAPVVPQLSTTNTQLAAVQNQINNQGNAAVKAYVVTTDINNDQEKIARINRAARIG